MKRLFKASLITICLTPAFALAQERCPIEKAVFAEADGGTELAFRLVGSDAAAVSHMFTVTGAKLKLDGHVMYDEESQRPAGMIMNNCPEGDATGAELRACRGGRGRRVGRRADERHPCLRRIPRESGEGEQEGLLRAEDDTDPSSPGPDAASIL